MKKTTPFLAFTLLIVASFSSHGQITFHKKIFNNWGFNAQSKGAQQTTDHGYILTGGVSSIELIKIDSTGAAVWGKSFADSPSSYDLHARAIQQTTDMGYIIAGDRYNPMPPYVDDMFLMKTDSNGVLSWIELLGIAAASHDEGASVQQTNDGGYIIAGTSSVFGIFVVKTNSTGNIAWRKVIAGGSGKSVRQTADGGYIIAGMATNASTSQNDVILVKTDGGGAILWTKTYGGAGDDRAFSVKQTTDGGYIIAGSTDSLSAAAYDAYLIKTDAGGNLLWSKTYNGTGYESIYSVNQTSDGGYILCGNTYMVFPQSEIYVVKTDTGGTMLWSKTYGEGSGYSVQQTFDGGYFVAGNNYIVKTDGNGNGNTCNEITLPVNFATPVTIVNSIVPADSIAGQLLPITVAVHIGMLDSNACASTGTGIFDIADEEEIEIYPNPSGSLVNIQNNSGQEIQFNLHTPLGKKIIHKIFTEKIMVVDLSPYPAGIYFAEIIKEKRLITKRLVKN